MHSVTKLAHSLWYCFQDLIHQTMLTNQNSIHKDIKSKLDSVNAWYHADKNLLSSCLLSKNIKINTYKTIILPILHECETKVTERGMDMPSIHLSPINTTT
jgi:hypothetical protein